MKKDDYLQFAIERFDHYYDSANNKSSLYIALNTFILGGICIAYVSLQENISFTGWTVILAIGLFISCALSIFFTIQAMTPFLQHGKFDNYNTSLLYFGGIARYPFLEFKARITALQEPKIEEELIHQSHCLACGLKRKYRLLQHAAICLLLEFIILFPLFLLIFKNYKS